MNAIYTTCPKRKFGRELEESGCNLERDKNSSTQRQEGKRRKRRGKNKDSFTRNLY